MPASRRRSILATSHAYWNPGADERGRSLQMAQSAVDEKGVVGGGMTRSASTRTSQPTGGTWLSQAHLAVAAIKEWICHPHHEVAGARRRRLEAIHADIAALNVPST